MPKTIDRVGRQYGRLRVLRMVDTPNGISRGCRTSWWECRCDCGNIHVAPATHLGSGSIVSCGCWRIENTPRCNTKHGHARRGNQSKTWHVWTGIVARCTRGSGEVWKKYGAKGTRVCERWLTDFAAFLTDMGERPEHMSIDRKENGGHYSCGKCHECLQNGWPANCRWATASQQQRNTSSNRWILIDGETRTLVEWCERYGVRYGTAQARLRRSWEPRDVFTRAVAVERKDRVQ